MTTTAFVTDFHLQFTAAGSPERAVSEKAYLKSDLAFYGMAVPGVRAAAKAFRRAHAGLSRADLIALATALWDTDWHELRSVGACLLELYADRLEAADMAFIESLLRRSNTWAHTDWLAPHVAGSLVSRYPEAKACLTDWAVSPYIWVRRGALLALLLDMRAGGGDFPLFAQLAAPMLVEKEFFIRKAIGWVLREVSHRRPELAYGFLAEHRPQVSGLTFREGSKYLPADMQKALAAQAPPKRPPSVK